MPVAKVRLSIEGPYRISEDVQVAYTESFCHEFQQVTATTDISVSLGGVTTVDLLYIKSDQAITVNLQADTGTDITVDANKPLLLTGTAITAIYISNASGSTANITVIGCGA